MIRKAEIRKVHYRDRDASAPIHDMTATRILAGLDELRGLARAGGHDAMVTSLNKAFDTCLAAYVAKKEAELAARIRNAQVSWPARRACASRRLPPHYGHARITFATSSDNDGQKTS